MAMKGPAGGQKGLATATKQPKFAAKDYDTSAHTATHHNKGTATGSVRDSAPMDYVRKTHAEGAKSEPVAGRESFDKTAVTERSMHVTEAPHCIGRSHPASNADGYRHAAHRRSGVLRNSGHPGAHRVGKR